MANVKWIVLLYFFGLTYPLLGLHVGAGFSLNTIDETFHSVLSTNQDRSGSDQYKTSANRLAPWIQVGYQSSFCNEWMIGACLQYKYLNYKTSNVNSSVGQILPNATFSSINIFGPKVIRDFTSKTSLDHEFKLLGYIGKQICSGYAYLGLGPVIFTGSNQIYVSSVHIPNGTGNHLISTSVKRHKVIYGGAVQVGYQYFFDPCHFIDISYSYTQTGNHHFNNTANAALLNGVDNPGLTTLFLKRTLKFAAQDLVCSMNFFF